MKRPTKPTRNATIDDYKDYADDMEKFADQEEGCAKSRGTSNKVLLLFLIAAAGLAIYFGINQHSNPALIAKVTAAETAKEVAVKEATTARTDADKAKTELAAATTAKTDAEKKAKEAEEKLTAANLAKVASDTQAAAHKATADALTAALASVRHQPQANPGATPPTPVVATASGVTPPHLPAPTQGGAGQQFREAVSGNSWVLKEHVGKMRTANCNSLADAVEALLAGKGFETLTPRQQAEVKNLIAQSDPKVVAPIVGMVK